jgi:hypothetical protein
MSVVLAGVVVVVQLFVVRLSYSGRFMARASMRCDQPSLFAGLLAAFTAFGGLTRADAAISAVLSCAITAPRAIVRTVAGGTAANNGFVMLPVDDARHRFEARGCYRLRAARILLENVIEIANVPPIHRDPFDRALVAQAQCNGLRSFVARLSWSSSAV